MSRVLRASAIALVVVLFLSGCGSGWVFDRTLVHDGITRYFDSYEPSRLPRGPVPLVLLLHGGGGDKRAFAGGSQGEFVAVAEREKFVVLMPNATDADTGSTGPTGDFNWNDCRTDAGPSATDADDVGFLTALIDWAYTQWNLDPERIYVTGASNGGMMSYRLALERADRFAAVAAIVANLPTSTECPEAPSQPLSVLIMNGTDDAFMPWAGGEVIGGRGAVASAEATRDTWRSLLGTGAASVDEMLPDLDPADAGRASRTVYPGGTAGARVVFFQLDGGGHNLPSVRHEMTLLEELVLGRQNHDLEAAEEIWRFFEGVE